MLIPLDLSDTLLAAELLHLQREAYRQEAELIAYAQLPPLLESLPQLLDCGETMLGWRIDGELLGAIGYSTEPGLATICRLVVAPAAQRRGIARHLLRAMLDSCGQPAVTVSTAAANLPALALYRQFGFELAHSFQTPDGLALVSLRLP